MKTGNQCWRRTSDLMTWTLSRHKEGLKSTIYNTIIYYIIMLYIHTMLTFKDMTTKSHFKVTYSLTKLQTKVCSKKSHRKLIWTLLWNCFYPIFIYHFIFMIILIYTLTVKTNICLRPVWIRSTCVGDFGRGGPGETGRSIWLELESGLSSGLSSSGGDGVLASRNGPESLVDKTETTWSQVFWLAA